MINKKKILVFTDWYLPGYKAGGPIRSVANLVWRLDLDFSVVTSDRDHDSERPYPDIHANKWIHGTQNERVSYLDPLHQQARQIKKLIREIDYDYIYLNSLFSPKFALLPLIQIKRARLQHKTVLAPRGMLKKGALSVKSGKKKLFLKLAKFLGLYKNITWHATNEEERDEILSFFPKATIKIAPNLVVPPKGKTHGLPKDSGSLKIVSIARISPEKNTLGAIEFIKRAFDQETDFTFNLYGTLENEEYLKSCRESARELGDKIQFHGPAEPHTIPGILKKHHLFFLPTLGENFGHAIMEAMLNGLPVLISDKTPWNNLQEANAGWDASLSDDKIPKILKEVLMASDEDFHIWRSSVVKYALEKIRLSGDVKKSYLLFP